MSAAGAASLGQIPEAVGVFLRAGRACALIGAPPAELADRVVALEDLWGAATAGLPAELADAAGVSRQHLTRSFREAVGVTPKLFARLARFQAGLAYAGCGAKVDWAQAALELGYADQSHMIAEFREFSSLTPEALARQRWFHPFIEHARSARSRGEVRSAYSRPSKFSAFSGSPCPC